MTRWLLIASLAFGLAALEVTVRPPAAHAQQDAGARVRKRLAEGQRLFGELEYRQVIRVLAPVPRDPAATRAQKLRALELIGLSHLILGEDARAREAFEDLLAIDPGYQLRDDTGSPKIRTFFDQVKRDYVPGFDAGAVAELEHSAPQGAVAGRRVEIEARVIEGGDQVKDMVTRWRQRGVLDYQSAPMRRLDDGRWRGRFEPPASGSQYVLEYYLEAHDLGGRAIGRVGGPETPLAFPVGPGGADRTPWYRRWYVIAGGAAAVGLTTVFLVTSGDSAPEGSLGNETLTP